MKKILSIALLALVLAPAVQAQSIDDQIAMVRKAHNTDREALITMNVHFTAAEGEAFWPLYREYRTAMRAKAFPGEDPATITQPADLAETFLKLASPSCDLNGEIVDYQSAG